MFFKRPAFAMTIYNLPRKFNIFSCSCHTGPLVEFPVQPPHQEDLNLPTFVKIGEPTDEDFFSKIAFVDGGGGVRAAYHCSYLKTEDGKMAGAEVEQ